VAQSLSGDQLSYRRLTDKPVVDKLAAATDTEQWRKTARDVRLATGQYPRQ